MSHSSHRPRPPPHECSRCLIPAIVLVPLLTSAVNASFTPAIVLIPLLTSAVDRPDVLVWIPPAADLARWRAHAFAFPIYAAAAAPSPLATRQAMSELSLLPLIIIRAARVVTAPLHLRTTLLPRLPTATPPQSS